MKKGKFAASVITTGLLIASLGMTAFAETPTDDTAATQTESRHERGEGQGHRQKPDKVSKNQDSSDQNESGTTDSTATKDSTKQKKKKKDKKNSPGAKISESIAALADGDAKTNAQAAYDAYDAAMEAKIKAEKNGASEDELSELKATVKEARKALDEALKAAGIEITKPEKRQKQTTTTTSE